MLFRSLDLHDKDEINLNDWWNGEEIDAMAGAADAPDFEPVGEDEQGRLDQVEKKEISCTCPNCGHEYVKQV